MSTVVDWLFAPLPSWAVWVLVGVIVCIALWLWFRGIEVA